MTIVDQADALVPAAQNALLKTLEEPLPASVFILVTSRPDMLLATVRSRCAQLRFGRLNVADVATVLERGHGYSHAEALTATVRRLGRERPPRAGAGGGRRRGRARGDAEALLGVAGRDPTHTTRLCEGSVERRGSAASEREHLGARLQALSSLLRDVGLLTSGADARLLANLDRRTALDAFARTLGSERIERIFATVARAHDALERNVSPKVVADWLAVNVH